MARFTLPPGMYHGKGSLEALKTLKGKKAFAAAGGGSIKKAFESPLLRWRSGFFARVKILKKPDESARARPVAGLATQKWGGIIAEEPGGKTSREGVCAGGDAVTGAATVILAMGAGKNAARAMAEYLESKS